METTEQTTRPAYNGAPTFRVGNTVEINNGTTPAQGKVIAIRPYEVLVQWNLKQRWEGVGRLVKAA